MIICALIMLLAANCPEMPDSSNMLPPSWTLPTATLRTRGAHEHDWIEGPRGGMYYWTDRGTKVYRKNRMRSNHED